MSLSWTNWKHWLSVGGTTFAGGALAYVYANLSGLAGGKWKAVAGGAVIAGLAAVFHLAQVPSVPALPGPSQEGLS